MKQQRVSLDIESVGLRGYQGIIWIVTLGTMDGKVKIWQDPNGIKRCPSELRSILEDETIIKVIHSSEFDAPYIELVWGVRIRNIEDTRLQEQIIQGVFLPRWKQKSMPPYIQKMYEQHSSSLKYVLPRYGLPEADKTVRTQFVDRPRGILFTKAELEYAKYDAKCLLPVSSAQRFILNRERLTEIALLENKGAEVVAQMKVIGLGFDKNLWKKITLDNQQRADYLIRKLSKKVANWNSPVQVKRYFQDKGVYIPSFDDLEKVYRKTGDEELGVFIEARDLMTQVSKYGFNWFEFVDADGRIRCQWEQILNTGRFSVSDPPIQGLKKDGPHRAAFVPAPGKVFVIGDYEGQEIGIMAAAADERLWVDAKLRGDDVHALTASIVFKNQWIDGKEKGCTFPQKCKCKQHSIYRHAAKTLNFALAYGSGIDRFVDNTGYDRVTAAGIIGRHKRAIPSVIRWLDRNAKESLKTGMSFSADPYRRRRMLKNEPDWRIINQGKNNPVQSAGANMVKLAMISMPEKYPIVFVWHDEIIIEVPRKEGKKALKVLKEVMEKSADYITGIEGLIKVEPRVANNLFKQ